VNRAAIETALEALSVGDVRLVEAVLLGALEDGKRVDRARCPICGLAFEWPGQLEHHRLVSHPIELLEAA
jgi:hypothetical protein